MLTIRMAMGNTQVVIENPVINSPFNEPKRHFRFSDEGITNEIVESRRVSAYFIPIAAPKKKGKKQLYFDTEWTKDRIEENKFINQIRERVKPWRTGGYVDVTKTTTRLLEYWQRPERDRRLFFCQIEALETAIYLAEVASKYGDAWIENELRRVNEDANPLCKEALLACSVLNARAYQAQISPDSGKTWIDMGEFNGARRIVLQPVTPGVVYTTQFRALGGSTKYSEWSDPVSHIAT